MSLKRLYFRIDLPCETHENGPSAAIVIVGLLQLGNDVLADGIIVPGFAHLGR